MLGLIENQCSQLDREATPPLERGGELKRTWLGYLPQQKNAS